MKQICDKSICTGCGLCHDICPRLAIRMSEQGALGHLRPEIIQEKCVDCKLCQKLCPALSEDKSHKTQKVYAAWMTDDDRRKGSSSGGVATEFYDQALKDGYAITGVRMTADFGAEMIVTTDHRDVIYFKSSKYMQADCRNVYKNCLEHLKNGKKILFIGTPCQCAAMQSLAGDKYDDLLITVELICHGVPSSRVFKDYITYIEKSKKGKITSASFRSEVDIEMRLSSQNNVLHQRNRFQDEYLYAFITGMLYEDCCYKCRYAKPERYPDITIGDFWGIGSKIPFNKPKCNVSVIMINTNKGQEFLSKCKRLYIEEREIEEALEGNDQLNWPSKISIHRETFQKNFSAQGIAQAFIATIHKQIRTAQIKADLKDFIKKCLKAIGLLNTVKNFKSKIK